MNASLKVAVVTGAGTGIGKASALALAEAGYQVAFAGRRQEILDKALAEAGGRGIAVATDVADPASVNAMVAEARTTLQKLPSRMILPPGAGTSGARAVPCGRRVAARRAARPAGSWMNHDSPRQSMARSTMDAWPRARLTRRPGGAGPLPAPTGRRNPRQPRTPRTPRRG